MLRSPLSHAGELLRAELHFGAAVDAMSTSFAYVLGQQVTSSSELFGHLLDSFRREGDTVIPPLAPSSWEVDRQQETGSWDGVSLTGRAEGKGALVGKGRCWFWGCKGCCGRGTARAVPPGSSLSTFAALRFHFSLFFHPLVTGRSPK